MLFSQIFSLGQGNRSLKGFMAAGLLLPRQKSRFCLVIEGTEAEKLAGIAKMPPRHYMLRFPDNRGL